MAFRRYLAELEAVPAAAERGMLPQYSAWAVAFGRRTEWSDALRMSALPPASANQAWCNYQASLITSPSFHSATTTASQVPSSDGGFPVTAGAPAETEAAAGDVADALVGVGAAVVLASWIAVLSGAGIPTESAFRDASGPTACE